MIYKFRMVISIVLFIITLITGMTLFGYTGCRDGWGSTSIGKQGACSHHGGVTSNKGFIFLATLGGSVWFYFWLSSLYRVKNGFVVKASLPPHPFEVELSSYRFHKVMPNPNTISGSRTSFSCALCHSVFMAGVKYKYNKKEGRARKYCLKCADELIEANARLEKEKTEHMNSRPRMLEEIHNYYAKHAKATL